MGYWKNASVRRALGDRSSVQVGMRISGGLDAQAVLGAVDRARPKVMHASGKLIRNTAKQSMRRTKAGIASPAGMPPHAHPRTKGNKGGGGLKKSIQYAVEQGGKNVVVGTSVNWGPGIRAVGEAHEKGGRVRVKNKRRRIRKIGDGGEIQVHKRKPRGKFYRTGKRVKGVGYKGRQTAYVIFARLETPAQVNRANDLNEILYGPEYFNADYPPRPFMSAALTKTRDELARLWFDKVK